MSETLGILHSAEEDNLSPFDLKIVCLYQSIEIDKNKYTNDGLYRWPFSLTIDNLARWWPFRPLKLACSPTYSLAPSLTRSLEKKKCYLIHDCSFSHGPDRSQLVMICIVHRNVMKLSNDLGWTSKWGLNTDGVIFLMEIALRWHVHENGNLHSVSVIGGMILEIVVKIASYC